MGTIEAKAYSRIVDYVKSNYEKISVTPGACRFNYRCHNNAVHDAMNDKHNKIALVVYIENGYPGIHFINYNEGVYIDNTVGHWCKAYDYHLIRFIDSSEFWDVYMIHTQFRKQLKEILPWWMKMLTNVDL